MIRKEFQKTGSAVGAKDFSFDPVRTAFPSRVARFRSSAAKRVLPEGLAAQVLTLVGIGRLPENGQVSIVGCLSSTVSLPVSAATHAFDDPPKSSGGYQ